MPVPSISFPIEVKDGWSFAGEVELIVKSLAGREEELESLSSEYAHFGQRRQETKFFKIGGPGNRIRCPSIDWSRSMTLEASVRGRCTSVRRRRNIGNKQRTLGSSPSPVRRRRPSPIA